MAGRDRSVTPKLRLPRLRGVMPRQRLLARLAGMVAPVRWIAAGPGCGKTTLAVGHVEALGERALWFNVDAGDDDPASFFDSLRRAAALAGVRRAAALPPWPGSGASVEAHARRFFRLLFAAWPAGRPMVFDNVHRAGSGAFIEVLNVALDELPAEARLLVLGHEPPPSALARHVVLGTIEVLGNAELRFTPAECAELLRQRLHAAETDLDSAVPGAAPDLHRRSEGWAAGLVLMIESLRHGRGPLAAGVEGAQRAAFDYLAGEVLARCTPGQQRDLLRVAALPRVSAPLASAVGAGPGLLAVLERLHRQHLFVERVAARDASYRLHGLFQAFLKDQAQAMLSVDERADAATQAARRLVHEGAAADAVQVLIDAECWPAAAECIAGLAPATLDEEPRRPFLAWASALPAEWLQRLPWLGYRAGASVVFEDPGHGARLLEQAHRGFVRADDRDGRVLAAGAITRARLLQPDWRMLDSWIDELHAQWAARGDGPDAPAALSPAADLIGGARLLYATLARCPGRSGQASAVAHVQAMLGRIEPSDEGLLAGFALLTHHNTTGQTLLARQLVRQLAPWAASEGIGVVARAYWAWAHATHLLWCSGHEQALAAFDRALELANSHRLAVGAVIRRHRVMALLTSQRLADAELELERLSSAPRVEPYFELKAWAALQRGDWVAAREEAEAALEWAQRRGRTYYVLQDHLLLAQIEARSGRDEAARQHLGHYREGSRGVPGEFPAYQAAWIAAHLAWQGGDRSACEEALATLAAIGERHHLRAFFGWDPAFVGPLLAQALASGTGADHARALIESHGLPAPAADTPGWPWPVRVLALGRFEVIVAGQPLRWGAKAPKKPLELLQALIALEPRTGQGVPIAALIDRLWPDADGDAAQNAFNVALSRLRKLLGDARAVPLQGGRLLLDAQRVWTDVAALQQLGDRIDEAGSSSDAEALARRLLELCRGPFLAGNTSAWASAGRERWRHRQRHWVTTLAELLQRCGQGDLASRLRGLLGNVEAVEAVESDALDAANGLASKAAANCNANESDALDAANGLAATARRR